MKNVAIYYEVLGYQDRSIELLEEKFTLWRFPEPGQENTQSLEEAEVLFAPLGYFIGDEMFRACPNLGVIASNTTGSAHIDVAAARERNIAVVTLQDETEFLERITPTAEFTFALILTLTRNLIPANQSVLAGDWTRWPYGGQGMLSRMTLGIIGFGRLGKLVARYADSFGMNVLSYDPYVEVTRHSTLKVDSLIELATKSDVVTVHAPLNSETTGLCGREFFGSMKEKSFFINTARGEIVDEEALIEALRSGRLSGAATDVLSGEFNPSFSVSENRLWVYAKECSNLILTPHIGGSTVDAWEATQMHTINMAASTIRQQK